MRQEREKITVEMAGAAREDEGTGRRTWREDVRKAFGSSFEDD